MTWLVSLCPQRTYHQRPPLGDTLWSICHREKSNRRYHVDIRPSPEHSTCISEFQKISTYGSYSSYLQIPTTSFQRSLRDNSPTVVIKRLIYYKIYGIGHCVSSCQLDPVVQAYMILRKGIKLDEMDNSQIQSNSIEKALQNFFKKPSKSWW